MKIDILITRYNEPVKLLLRLLDSIKNQLNFDFNNLNVFIINDGIENAINTDFIQNYPFKITYKAIEKSGVSVARQLAFNLTNSDYVMFCDTDDFFHSCFGLATVYTALTLADSAPDLVQSLVAETDACELNNKNFINYATCDGTIHGKVFKRSFLVKHNITWNPDLTLYEDGVFTLLVRSFQPKTSAINLSFYCYDHFNSSVTRALYGCELKEAINKSCTAINTLVEYCFDFLTEHNNITFINKLFLNSICIYYLYIMTLKLANKDSHELETTLYNFYTKYNEFILKNNIKNEMQNSYIDIIQNLYLEQDPLLTTIQNSTENMEYCIINFKTWFEDEFLTKIK